jgi:hypothetical protein
MRLCPDCGLCLAISRLESGEALVEAVEPLHQCLHPKKDVQTHRVEAVEAVDAFFITKRKIKWVVLQ